MLLLVPMTMNDKDKFKVPIAAYNRLCNKQGQTFEGDCRFGGDSFKDFGRFHRFSFLPVWLLFIAFLFNCERKLSNYRQNGNN